MGVLIKAAKAVNAQEILLFTQGQLLSLVAVVDNLGLGEVHESKVVFGVKLGAERRLEGRVLGDGEWVGCVVLRRHWESGGQGKLGFLVFGGQSGQRRKALDGSRQNRLKR